MAECKSAQIEESPTTVERERDELADQFDALTKALALLSEIIRLTNHANVLDEDESRNMRLALESELNQLRQRWKLEDTPFITLYENYLMLESKLNTTTKEADKNIHEIRDLHRSLRTSKKENVKLLRIIEKLALKNKDLCQRIKKKNKERRSVMNSLKEFVSNINKKKLDMDERSMSIMVKMHEEQLKILARDRMRMSPTGANGQLMNQSDRSLASTPSTISSSSIDTDNFSSISNTNSFDSQYLAYSSSVGNEEEITHCEHMAEKYLRTYKNNDTEEKSEESSNNYYELKFVTGKRIGLQFQIIPNDVPEVRHNIDLVRGGIRGILSDVVNLNNNSNSHNNHTSSSQPDPSQNVGHNPKHKQKYDGFYVCGFEGFDETINGNRRPTLGARLIAVDGESIETNQPDLSFEKLRYIIESKTAEAEAKAITGEPAHITMRFRNDVLTKKQSDELNQAINAVRSQSTSQES